MGSLREVDILAAVLVMIVVVVSTTALERSLSQQFSRRLNRIEGKLDQLLQHAGVEPQPLPAEDEIRELMLAGRKIEAIKVYRKATGTSLAEAKAIIDKIS